MKFIVDKEQKVIFGWSGKCGCSHLKNIIKFMKNLENLYIVDNSNWFDCLEKHGLFQWDKINPLPDNIEEYTTIIVARNPYERIVSYFRDKIIAQSGTATSEKRKTAWLKKNPISFETLVKDIQLLKDDVNYKSKSSHLFFQCPYSIGWLEHHVTPQVTEDFDERIFQSKELKVYDLKRIDYGFIEGLYGKTIPERLLRKTEHTKGRISSTPRCEQVHDKTSEELKDIYTNYHWSFYYTKELENIVKEIYKDDFEFLAAFDVDKQTPMLLQQQMIDDQTERKEKNLVVIISGPRHSSTSLCNALKEIEDSMTFYELFNKPPRGILNEIISSHETRDRHWVEKIVEALLNQPRKYLIFKIFASHLRREVFLDFLKVASDRFNIKFIFLTRNMTDVYSSYVKSMTTGNWATSPEHREEGKGFTNFKGTPLPFKKFKRRHQSWFQYCKNLLNDFDHIEAQEITFSDVVSNSITLQKLKAWIVTEKKESFDKIEKSIQEPTPIVTEVKNEPMVCKRDQDGKRSYGFLPWKCGLNKNDEQNM